MNTSDLSNTPPDPDDPLPLSPDPRVQSTAEFPAPVSSIGIPQRVGPYLVRGIIGEGGMGVVLEAEHERLGSRAAVKLIRRGLAGKHASPQVIARFIDESRLLAMLDHPAICRVLDAGTYEEPAGASGAHGAILPYFAMEFILGARDLRAYCLMVQPDRRTVARLLLPILDAVEYGHQRGVLHRDLKPENILIGRSDGSDEDRAKLIDFGIARAVGAETVRARLTVQGSFLGTPRYASPEQLAGDSRGVDQRTDVYALGVILHEVMLGQHPYGLGDVDAHMAAAAISRAPALRATRTGEPGQRDLEILLHTAVAREPASRYQTVASLAADLRRWLNDEPVLARQPGWWTLGFRKARAVGCRNRPITRLSVALVAAVAAMHPPALVYEPLSAAQRTFARLTSRLQTLRAPDAGLAVVQWTDQTKPEDLGPLLGLDDVQSVEHPTWRTFMGKVIERLADVGVSAVVVDIDYDTPSEISTHDEHLAESIRKTIAAGVPVVFARKNWFSQSCPAVQALVHTGGVSQASIPGYWVGDLTVSRTDAAGATRSDLGLITYALAAQRVPGSTPDVTILENEGLAQIKYFVSESGRPVDSGVRDVFPVHVETITVRNDFFGFTEGDVVASVVAHAWSAEENAAVTVLIDEVVRDAPGTSARLRGKIALLARCTHDPSREPDLSPHPTTDEDTWCIYSHASSLAALITNSAMRMPSLAFEWIVTLASAAAGTAAGSGPRRRRWVLLATFACGLVLIASGILSTVFAGLILLPAHALVALGLASLGARWLAPRAAR
jgi:serine/threonine protein kinase/CHASE2 domain-containing sensor protein